MENISPKKTLLKRIKSSNLDSQSNLATDKNIIKFTKLRDTNFKISKKTNSIAYDNLSFKG